MTFPKKSVTALVSAAMLIGIECGLPKEKADRLEGPVTTIAIILLGAMGAQDVVQTHHDGQQKTAAAKSSPPLPIIASSVVNHVAPDGTITPFKPGRYELAVGHDPAGYGQAITDLFGDEPAPAVSDLPAPASSAVPVQIKPNSNPNQEQA